jgi:hypothetical protein
VVSAEETVLWFGQEPEQAMPPEARGTDREKAGVDAGRPSILPGSRELDEALAALDALAGTTPRPIEVPDARQESTTLPPVPPPDATDEVGSPADDVAWPPADRDIPSTGASSVEPPVVESRPVTPGSAPGTLLRDVRRSTPVPPSPASRAYRRLRRIFPG